MQTSPDLLPGDVLWALLEPTEGREQAGRRPVVVVSSAGLLATVDTLALVVPVTTTDRGWPNHVHLRSLDRPSWAMTEQIRAISRTRLGQRAGVATNDELAQIRGWLGAFLDL